MKSPFTGKEMSIVYEDRLWKFRGEEFKYTHSAWLCADTGEMLTTEEMDDASYTQVTNQYRAKYGIPFTDEIIAVRARYGLSAAKMSQILGIGINQWRSYEDGEVPNVSNGRMIRSIMNPKVFQEYINSARAVLGEKEYAKLSTNISATIQDSQKHMYAEYNFSRVFQARRSIENGYAPQSLTRLKNILLYILEHCSDVFCTKMNKILFYADFLAYRRHGKAITGLSYKAITYGPVPERWDRIYSQFDEIVQELRSYGDKEGCVLTTDSLPDLSLLTPNEIKILDEICSSFSNYTSAQLTDLSHQESAWLNNVNHQNRITFDLAFSLKAV